MSASLVEPTRLLGARLGRGLIWQTQQRQISLLQILGTGGGIFAVRITNFQ